VGRLTVAIAAAAVLAVAGPAAAHAQVTDVSNTPTLAEGEETVAINPANPDDIVVGSNQWQPATPNNAGNFGLGASGVTTCAVWSSHDGGRTWKGGRLENSGLDQLGGPLRPLVQVPSEFGDPDVGNLISADQNTVFDRHGNAWYQCINAGAGSGDVKVFVYRSSDGGSTWSAPVAAFSELDTRIQLDRGWLAIDDSGGPRDGTLYLTFETMFYQAYLPEVYARKSTDGGRTWGPIVRVDHDDNRAQWDPRQYPVVGADGTLYVVYDAAALVSPAPVDAQVTPLKLMVGRSSDGGQTFDTSVVEPSVTRIKSPDEAFSYFTEEISAIAADPSHPGRVAVAWPDARSGDARILMRYSLDGAHTWSPIVEVPDDPAGDHNQHDHVGLTYLPDGRLVVVWRDRRASGGAFGGALDVFARVFTPRPDGQLVAGSTLRLTDSSQPDGQSTHGNMPTEYLGVASDASGVAVSWDEMRGQFLDNVFRRVPIAALGAPPAAAPGPSTCVDRRGFSFRLHHPRGERITLATVRVNGRLTRVLRGRALTHLTLRRLPQRLFTVTIVTYTDRGTRAWSTRTYRGCAKTPPRNRFALGHRRRRSGR
jgi:hypothetical protein